MEKEKARALYLAALDEVFQRCKEEYYGKEEDYGGVWLEEDLDVRLAGIKTDANRLPTIKDPEKLRHKMIDLINYVVFCYAKVGR